MWNDLLHIPYLRYRISCQITGPLLYLPPISEIEGEEGKPVSRGLVLYSLLRDFLRRQYLCTTHNLCESCQKGIPCEWMSLFGNGIDDEHMLHFIVMPPLSPKKSLSSRRTFLF